MFMLVYSQIVIGNNSFLTTQSYSLYFFQAVATFPFKQKWFYYALGYGVSFFIVFVSFLADQDGYGTSEL